MTAGFLRTPTPNSCAKGSLQNQLTPLAMNRLKGSLSRAIRSTLLSQSRLPGQVRGTAASRTIAAKAVRAPSRLARDSEDGAADTNHEAKARALDAVLKDVNARFGKGSIMKLGSTQPTVETISSGALTLDIALGGGFPKGRIIEVFGPESSGKTTLALHAMAEVQRQGGTAALIDAEHAFDPVYSKKAGLDVESIILCQPDSGEMALEVVDQLVRSSAVDIICVDSVAALVPKAEIEGEIGSVQVGAQARLMSHALRKITQNASKCNTTVLFLNQLRYKVGVIYGNPEITSGGNALKFYSSVRLEVRRKATIEGAKGENTGIRVKAKVVKNKCAPPYKLCEFDILFGSGISSLGCMLDAAEAVDIVQRKGSWYSYGEQRLGQGREKTLAILMEDTALASEIEAKTRLKMLSPEVDINDLYDDEAVSADEEDAAAPELEVEELPKAA